MGAPRRLLAGHVGTHGADRSPPRQTEWAGLFLFIGCYASSVMINATFDVALEGPMQGIWFWCLIGFGIGSVMIYRCQLNS